MLNTQTKFQNAVERKFVKPSLSLSEFVSTEASLFSDVCLLDRSFLSSSSSSSAARVRLDRRLSHNAIQDGLIFLLLLIGRLPGDASTACGQSELRTLHPGWRRFQFHADYYRSRRRRICGLTSKDSTMRMAVEAKKISAQNRSLLH